MALESTMAVGLEQAAVSAQSPFMREVAFLAWHQGLTFGSLRDALNDHLAGSRDTSNVRRLFQTKKPSPDIINALAAIVKLTGKYRRAVEQRLTPKEHADAITAALGELQREQSILISGTLDAVQQVVLGMSPERYARVTAAYVVAQFHADADLEDPRLWQLHPNAMSRLGEPLTAFLSAFDSDELDPERLLRSGTATTQSLHYLYALLRNWALTPPEAETVLSVVESFLIRHGVRPAEVTAMRDYLKRNRDQADAAATALARQTQRVK